MLLDGFFRFKSSRGAVFLGTHVPVSGILGQCIFALIDFRIHAIEL